MGLSDLLGLGFDRRSERSAAPEGGGLDIIIFILLIVIVISIGDGNGPGGSLGGASYPFRLDPFVVLKHLRIHLQRQIAEAVILDFERSFQSPNQAAVGLEVEVDVIAVSLLVDGIRETPRAPFVDLDDLAPILFDELAHSIDESANLIIVENAVDDVGQLVRILSHRSPCGIIVWIMPFAACEEQGFVARIYVTETASFRNQGCLSGRSRFFASSSCGSYSMPVQRHMVRLVRVSTSKFGQLLQPSQKTSSVVSSEKVTGL